MTSNSILVKRKVCPTCLGSNFETIKEISYSNNQLINFIRQQYDTDVLPSLNDLKQVGQHLYITEKIKNLNI